MAVHYSITSDKPVIVLDAGKVLVDYRLDLFFANISRLSGKIVDQRFSPTLEKIYLPMEVGATSLGDVVNALNTEYGVSLTNEKWQELWRSIFTVEMPGMYDALLELKNNFRLVVLSNTIEVHWTYLLDSYPIFNLFDGLVTSYQEGVAKPDHAIYQIVENRFCDGRPPLFYTDDMDKNVDAARKFGWEAEVFNGAEHFRIEVEKRCKAADV